MDTRSFYFELVPGKEPVPPRIRISMRPLHCKLLMFVLADKLAIGEDNKDRNGRCSQRRLSWEEIVREAKDYLTLQPINA